jgi:hypothetical protein
MCSGKERGNKLAFLSDDKKAQTNCKMLNCLLVFLIMVLIQSSRDDLLSEGNLQEPFLCSWPITQFAVVMLVSVFLYLTTIWDSRFAWYLK